MAIAIETAELTKEYFNGKGHNIVAVNNLNLKLNEGEIFTFLGPNGAGKTTTVRLLATLLKPTKGTAFILGYDIKVDPINIRRRIGLLTDQSNLYLRLTAKRNLLFFGRMYGLNREEVIRRTNKLTKQFDLEKRLDSPVGSFSKGMKQKLSFVRALLHDPDVLFLDEPTASLDPLAQETVRDIILTITKETAVTVFLTTHNLYEAQKLSDKVGLIKKGQLVALDTINGLRKKLGKQLQVQKKLIIRTKTIFDSRTINNINGVLAINKPPENNEVIITVDDFHSTTPIIIEALVKHKIPILSVEPQEEDLETIYRKIMINN